jgi:hypothetical protein
VFTERYGLNLEIWLRLIFVFKGLKLADRFMNTPSVFMKLHISLDTTYTNFNKKNSVKRCRIYPEDGGIS